LPSPSDFLDIRGGFSEIAVVLNILMVAAGGAVGSVLRYLVSGLAQRASGVDWFPLGTLGVNLLGCLAIGFLGGLVENREVFSPTTRTLLFIGVLGGFTTFSTFGFETFALLRDRQTLYAVVNVTAQVLGGLFAVWLGYSLTVTR